MCCLTGSKQLSAQLVVQIIAEVQQYSLTLGFKGDEGLPCHSIPHPPPPLCWSGAPNRGNQGKQLFS